jgi:hypothetical protein
MIRMKRELSGRLAVDEPFKQVSPESLVRRTIYLRIHDPHPGIVRNEGRNPSGALRFNCEDDLLPTGRIVAGEENVRMSKSPQI